jgi:uncharacterized protein (TIGR00369 family)
MRKLNNPFKNLEGYNCFGCSPDNQSGLQLSFYEDNDELVSLWNPKSFFQGYQNVLHGGIQASLMDEIASWVIYVKLKTTGFTSNLNVRYLKPVNATDPQITLRARVKNLRRNLADIEVRLYNHNNLLCAEALVTYFTFSREKAEGKVYLPDHRDFFRDDPVIS